MSTNNMAASWRQANDVIAPGWSEWLLKLLKDQKMVKNKKMQYMRFFVALV